MSDRSAKTRRMSSSLHVRATEAVDVVHDRRSDAEVVERAADLEEERAALGAEALGAVEHGNGLDALERLGELGERERAEARGP